MKPLRCLILLCAVSGVLLLTNGCASPDVNPQAARSDRGYVDLFTRPKADVWWKVDVFNASRRDYKEFTAQFKAPEQGIFRVEARPGHYKARIGFVNQAVEAPAEVEVEVREGMITPVEIKLEQGGSSYVRVVEDRGRAGFRTAGRNQVTDYSQSLWQISATVQFPATYTPKENTAYWK